MTQDVKTLTEHVNEAMTRASEHLTEVGKQIHEALDKKEINVCTFEWDSLKNRTNEDKLPKKYKRGW